MCPRVRQRGCESEFILVPRRTRGQSDPRAGRPQEAQVTERRFGEAPGLHLYLTEPGRAVADFGLYLAARPLSQSLPHGDGHPVLVLPGLLADDVSTRAL